MHTANEYLEGMLDCKQGKPHQKGRSVDYDCGYGDQFNHEASATALALQEEVTYETVR